MQTQKLVHSLEAIVFQQKGLFFAELSTEFGVLKGQHGVNDDFILPRLEAIAKKYTNMFVIFEVYESSDYHISCIVDPLSPNHPLLTNDMKLKVSRLPLESLLVDKIFDGSVDLKTGKVSGLFETMPVRVRISSQMLKGDTFTGAELAAKALHELGHGHAYFELMAKTFQTNLVMREVATQWAGTTDTRVRVSVLTSIEKLYGSKFEDKNALAESQDVELVETVVLSHSIENIRSELGTKFYDQRTFEFLADQFAARHGAGRDLITALDKLGRMKPLIFRANEYQSTPTLLLFSLAGLAFDFLGFRKVKGAWAVTATVANLIENQFLNATIGLVGGLLFKNYTYDDPEPRYNAIRREVVAALKDLKLPAANQRKLLEDLVVIDEAIKKLNTTAMPSTKALGKFLASFLKGDKRELKFQRQYEELANNDLFVRAAQLNQLSDQQA